MQLFRIRRQIWSSAVASFCKLGCCNSFYLVVKSCGCKLLANCDRLMIRKWRSLLMNRIIKKRIVTNGSLEGFLLLNTRSCLRKVRPARAYSHIGEKVKIEVSPATLTTLRRTFTLPRILSYPQKASSKVRNCLALKKMPYRHASIQNNIFRTFEML